MESEVVVFFSKLIKLVPEKMRSGLPSPSKSLIVTPLVSDPAFMAGASLNDVGMKLAPAPGKVVIYGFRL